MTYDSTQDTLAHIRRVQRLLADVAALLVQRGIIHDASKLQSPEKECFDVITPRLKGVTYGSEEYKATLREMKPAIEHHQKHNRHHPEYWPECDDVELDELRSYILKLPAGGQVAKWLAAYLRERESSLNHMTLLDLIEMICDWKAASERHADGDIERSITINKSRFKFSDQLESIFRRTVGELFPSHREPWHCFGCGAGGCQGNFCEQCGAGKKDYQAASENAH